MTSKVNVKWRWNGLDSVANSYLMDIEWFLEDDVFFILDATG